MHTTTRGGKKPFSLAPPLRAVGTFPAAGGSVPVQKSLKNVFGQMATREFFQTPLIRRPKSRCRGGVPGSPPPGGRGDCGCWDWPLRGRGSSPHRRRLRDRGPPPPAYSSPGPVPERPSISDNCIGRDRHFLQAGFRGKENGHLSNRFEAFRKRARGGLGAPSESAENHWLERHKSSK